MRNKWEDEYADYEDLYTSSYAPKVNPYKSVGGWKSKYGSSGWSRSSWSSFSFELDHDNNDDLFVKDPVTYLTPTVSEIKKKCRARKQESFDMIKELARVCYFKMIDESDYIADQHKEVENPKKKLYDDIFNQYIPGYTPLEQAISIYLKLQKEGESGEPRDDDDVDMKKGLEFDRNLYSDPDINEQLELNELSKDMKMEILNKLSIVGKLGSEFKVEKEISAKIVANSDQYQKMIMRSHDQVTMVDMYQRVLPNFDIKFLTKDLTVNVPVDRKEQKQKIIIILDFSGSMDENSKQLWVNAILIDRFKYVMRGEAEVFFSYFIHNAEDLEFQHIQSKGDVINFWQTFSNEPNGGTTEVGEMVKCIASDISLGKLCNLDVDLSQEKPEILVINDGQDYINIDKFPYKVNAVTLMEYNEDLKNLCLETGGKLVNVQEDERVYTYSVEGGQQEVKK
jgi:hypothetical protein